VNVFLVPVFQAPRPFAPFQLRTEFRTLPPLFGLGPLPTVQPAVFRFEQTGGFDTRYPELRCYREATARSLLPPIRLEFLFKGQKPSRP